MIQAARILLSEVDDNFVITHDKDDMFAELNKINGSTKFIVMLFPNCLSFN